MGEAKHTASSVAAEAASNLRGVHARMDCEAHPERAVALLAGASLVEAAPDMLRELVDILEWAKVEKAPLRKQEIESISRVVSKATGAQ